MKRSIPAALICIAILAATSTFAWGPSMDGKAVKPAQPAPHHVAIRILT